MNAQNIFEDDWRDCLRAHFAHVIKERDTNNEASLITVLAQTGFTGEDIQTMREQVLAELGWTSDATPTDSVADSIAEPPAEPPEAASEPAAEAAPVEHAVPIGEIAPAEGLAPETSLPEVVEPPEDPTDEPPAPPVQMSLF